MKKLITLFLLCVTSISKANDVTTKFNFQSLKSKFDIQTIINKKVDKLEEQVKNISLQIQSLKKHKSEVATFINFSELTQLIENTNLNSQNCEFKFKQNNEKIIFSLSDKTNKLSSTAEFDLNDLASIYEQATLYSLDAYNVLIVHLYKNGGIEYIKLYDVSCRFSGT